MSRAVALLPARARGESPTPTSDWPRPVRILEPKKVTFLEESARGARGFSFVSRAAVDPRASDRPRRHCASRDERRGAPPRRGRGARGWRARARARASVHADGLGQGTSRVLGDRASCPANRRIFPFARRTPFLAPSSLLVDRSRSSAAEGSRPRDTLATDAAESADDAPTLTPPASRIRTRPRAALIPAGNDAAGPPARGSRGDRGRGGTRAAAAVGTGGRAGHVSR